MLYVARCFTPDQAGILAEAMIRRISSLVPDECLLYHSGMNNPWIDLPTEAPYLLPADCDAIHRFNTTASTDHIIHTEMCPEPFMGLPHAPVVLLGLNPGAAKEEFQPPTDPILLQAYADNLQHTITDIPFYLLNPAIGGAGYQWWTAKLRPLLQRYDEHFLAQHLFAVEYFPYHSHRFSHRLPFVESQHYTRYLVQQAIERDAVIIVMRSYRLWIQAVPDLASYPHIYRLKNPLNVIISPNNCPGGFAKIVEILDMQR